MPDLEIRSHRGPYTVAFGEPFAGLAEGLAADEHLLVDARVAELYAGPLKKALGGASVLRIDATEESKSLERLPGYATHLIERGLRRGHTLIAVGGGIIQDITAFLAATMLRGVPWRFYPTTLLAQADSCIGSKSSINVGPYKNQLGTFTPPSEIRLSTEVLATLSDADLRSGIGEMIKVHGLSGWDDVAALEAVFDRLVPGSKELVATLKRSLEIKKRLIEIDEFDKKERLVLNYGHSFGHAIETATQYAVPHGIAVTMGLGLANDWSVQQGFLDASARDRLRPMIEKNGAGFESVEVSQERFFAALSKDKKNQGKKARLVLLKDAGQGFLHDQELSPDFKEFCRSRLSGRLTAIS